jgi:hypothetical protein
VKSLERDRQTQTPLALAKISATIAKTLAHLPLSHAVGSHLYHFSDPSFATEWPAH